VSCVIGKRTAETTHRFLSDVKSRITDARFQLTTDGFHFYRRGVEMCSLGSGLRAAYQAVRGHWPARRRSEVLPTKNHGVISKIRDGRPDPEHISTSYVERANLSLRMHLRRYTRLTNAFSKKLDNLKAAVTLYVAFYNFCRTHQTLRVTPAMEAGLTDHVWSVAELLQTV